jgi:3'-phosphoadenosine 5'-phosphosulfate (PAPS) 3'-phosphatase
MTQDELVIYYPDGSKFLNPVELSNYAEQETQRAEREKLLKEQETQRAEREKLLKEQETQRAEREKLLKEQETQRAERERLLKEQEQIKYQTLLSQLKAKGIDITALE